MTHDDNRTHDYELRPFAAKEADLIAGWARRKADVAALDTAAEFPLTGGHVLAWVMEANSCWTLRRDGDLAAYAEIVEDEVEGDVEIQHLLVAPDLRASGVGRALLDALCAFLSANRPYPEVWVRVGRDNLPAERCARAVGFTDIVAMSGPRFLWMKRHLKQPL